LNNLYGEPKDPFNAGWIVVVVGPTGLAAYNVKGQTIHRFFKLPIFKDAKYDRHWQLSDAAIKMMRMNMTNIKAILGDELSMISNTRLAQIHRYMSNRNKYSILQLYNFTILVK